MFQLFAFLASSAFAGVCLYVNLFQIKAKKLDANTAVKHWQVIFTAADPMQPLLAMIGGISGIMGFLTSWHPFWLIGALLILANVPFTLLLIFPINKRLMATKDGEADQKSLELIDNWNKLHAFRTIFGTLATIFFFFALKNMLN